MSIVTTPTARSTSCPPTRLHVLFVDDEPKVLDGLRRMLRRFRDEWDMQFADGGEKALELLATQRFDVVVSDMRMPGMDGAELLKRVQAIAPDTVRIVLSGHSEQESVLRAAGPSHQYLSKPCDPDLLESTIRHTCEARRTIGSPQVRAAVGRINVLPSLPNTYVELLAELRSPAASIRRAGEIIAHDLGVSSKILQLVNSSFFGLPVHVADVTHATMLLGIDVVKPLVLSTGVFRSFDTTRLGNFDLPRLVEHSLEVALAARRIAALENFDRESCDHAFLAGLLHDLGQVLFAEALPADYQCALAQVAAGDTTLVDAEQLLFGTSHGLAGAYLLGLWGLPDPVVRAVAWHDCPSAAPAATSEPLLAVQAAEALLDAHRGRGRERHVLDYAYLEKLECTHRVTAWQHALLD